MQKKGMPKFAVMNFMFASWWQEGKISIEEFLEGVVKAGAQGVEPFHRDFLQNSDFINRYQSVMRATGLQVPVVDVICNLVYTNKEEQQRHRDELCHGLEICRSLNSEIAHVAGHKLAEGISPKKGREMIAEELLWANATAKEYGLVLAIENYSPSPTLVCSVKDCLEIIHLSQKEVCFVFDTGNFITVGEKADEVFDDIADHICHCHFKDFVRDPVTNRLQGCALETGEIHNEKVAQKLSARGYNGWVALETGSRPNLNPIQIISQELPILKSWF